MKSYELIFEGILGTDEASKRAVRALMVSELNFSVDLAKEALESPPRVLLTATSDLELLGTAKSLANAGALVALSHPDGSKVQIEKDDEEEETFEFELTLDDDSERGEHRKSQPNKVYEISGEESDLEELSRAALVESGGSSENEEFKIDDDKVVEIPDEDSPLFKLDKVSQALEENSTDDTGDAPLFSIEEGTPTTAPSITATEVPKVEDKSKPVEEKKLGASESFSLELGDAPEEMDLLESAVTKDTEEEYDLDIKGLSKKNETKAPQNIPQIDATHKEVEASRMDEVPPLRSLASKVSTENEPDQNEETTSAPKDSIDEKIEAAKKKSSHRNPKKSTALRGMGPLLIISLLILTAINYFVFFSGGDSEDVSVSSFQKAAIQRKKENLKKEEALPTITVSIYEGSKNTNSQKISARFEVTDGVITEYGVILEMAEPPSLSPLQISRGEFRAPWLEKIEFSEETLILNLKEDRSFDTKGKVRGYVEVRNDRSRIIADGELSGSLSEDLKSLNLNASVQYNLEDKQLPKSPYVEEYVQSTPNGSSRMLRLFLSDSIELGRTSKEDRVVKSNL